MPATQFIVPPAEVVTYGQGALARLPDLIERLGGTKAFVVLSGSLSGTQYAQSLIESLGDRHAGTYARTKQHVPRSSVLEAAAAARESDADLIISFGGGTPIDCAKAVTLCLAQNITEARQFDDYRVRFTYPSTYEVPDVPGDVIPHIAIPTTLSGGEHTGLFGVTDETTHLKGSYSDPKFNPRAVILDPEATAHTPGWLWAASGMRAVDHAVEGILSQRSMPLCDALAGEALNLLSANLVTSTNDATDLDARTNCLVGTWLSIFALTNVGVGLSHGIGHQLATEFDMIHGVTSAIMLPHVMEFIAPHTGPKMRRIAEVFGRDVRTATDDVATAQAIDAVQKLIAELKVPHRISDAGGNTDALEGIAERVMQDPAVAACPRPIADGDIRQLLETAW